MRTDDPSMEAPCIIALRTRVRLFLFPCCWRGQPPLATRDAGGVMEEISDELAERFTRVCAIDIGQAGLVAACESRTRPTRKRRVREVREYAIVTPARSVHAKVAVARLSDDRSRDGWQLGVRMTIVCCCDLIRRRRDAERCGRL